MNLLNRPDIQKWLQEVFPDGDESFPKRVKRHSRGKIGATRRGAKHVVNPVWKPISGGVTPAQYRRLHMGAKHYKQGGKIGTKTRHKV